MSGTICVGHLSADNMDLKVLSTVRALISPHVNVTPVINSAFMDKMSGARLYFKCENLQKTGSFKARGAVNAVLKHIEVNHVLQKRFNLGKIAATYS